MAKPTFHALPEEKRRRIVDAAIEEFSEQPYRQASVSRIVERTGIAKGSIYQYFDNKLDLYGYLLEEAAKSKAVYFDAHAAPDPADIFGTLERIALAGLRFARDNPRLARLSASIAEPGVDPELADLRDRMRDLGHQWARDLLKQAQEAGAVRLDVDPDLGAVLIQKFLNDGLIDVLLRRLRLSSAALFSNTPRTRELSDKDVRALARDLVDVLRRGLGRSGR